MKITVSLVLFTILSVNLAAQSTSNSEKEKAAVIAAIEEETAAYYAADLDRWTDSYVQNPTNVQLSAGNYGYNSFFGWENISSGVDVWFPVESMENNEVKTPLMVKVYDNSAWIVFKNKPLQGESLVTCFLEKQDGKWKIVNRITINTLSYLRGDNFLINSINFAKSSGESVESFAAFTGNQFKMGWPQNMELRFFVFNVNNNWSSIVRPENRKVLEMDENHAVLQFTNLLPDLKNAPMFNVTYDDYLNFVRIVFEKIADHIGMIYTQENIPDGVKISILKKI